MHHSHVNKEKEHLLVEQTLSGDQYAFEHLVNEYKDYVFQLILGILKNTEDAEEVTMDTFVKAFEKLNSFQFDAKSSTWIYTIAYRHALMFLRKKRMLLSDLKDGSAFSYEQSMDPLIHEDQEKMIEWALDRLGEEDRVLITLYYLEELSLKEIEEITNIKAATAKVRIHRSRKKIAEILNTQYSELELKNVY